MRRDAIVTSLALRSVLVEEPKESPPPERPRTEAELGFRKQTFVRWFNPQELARAGAYALLSELFGSFADKREVQAALQHSTVELQRQYENEASDDDFWFDFVADVGDGFDATYSIASLLAQPSLRVANEELTLPRGRLLLMGGDEVYPTASRKQYADRTVGPYRAALPYVSPESSAPHLYAIPGNHDWYDGLAAFLRQFAQKKGRWIGAWRTQQRRSYFVRKLPRGVWLWGIDIQLHADIDSPQLEYFERAGAELAPGDRVILATAEPSWVKEAEGDRAGYQSLLLILGMIPPHASVALVLTGDSHHYAHYRDRDGVHFVTAGGGGAFLHGTHTLPDEISLVARASGHGTRRLERVEIFPDEDTSRRLVRRKLWLFPYINWLFALVWLALWLWFGAALWSDGVKADGTHLIARLAHAFDGPLGATAHLVPPFTALLLVCVLARTFIPHRPRKRAAPELPQADAQRKNRPFEWRKYVDTALWTLFGGVLILFGFSGAPSPVESLARVLPQTPNAALVALLVPIASALYVSRPIEWSWPSMVRLLLGWFHGSLYGLTWLLFATLVARVTQNPFLWVTLSAAFGAVTSTLLFVGCLWFAGQYQRALLNDVFSAIGEQNYKNFLRLRVGRDGALTVFAIGLEQVVKKWDVNPDTHPSAPFLVPAAGRALAPHLIERFTVPPPAARNVSQA